MPARVRLPLVELGSATKANIASVLADVCGHYTEYVLAPSEKERNYLPVLRVIGSHAFACIHQALTDGSQCGIEPSPNVAGPSRLQEKIMSVARVTELISASTKSFEDAVQVGVSRAVKTLKNVEGVWVDNQKCVIENGKIAEYRVNLKVTFILED
jgi:dodecin